MRSRIFLILVSLLLVGQLPARAFKSIGGGVGLAAGMAHSGFASSLLIPIDWHRHTIYAGPRLLLSESYFPYSNTWGLQMGYAYRVMQMNRWGAEAAFDYQWGRYRPYFFGGPRDYNHLHEFNLFIGLSYAVFPKQGLDLKLHTGTGLYMDRWQDLSEGRKRSGVGRTSAVRLTLSYKLF